MRYTYVRQHDTTDCAAACLAMVCLHYKKEVTITRLRDMMGTDLKGTNLVGLQKAANELGFSTAAVRVDRRSSPTRAWPTLWWCSKRPPSAMTASAASTC